MWNMAFGKLQGRDVLAAGCCWLCPDVEQNPLTTVQRHLGLCEETYWVFSPRSRHLISILGVNLCPSSPEKDKSLNQLVLTWELVNAKGIKISSSSRCKGRDLFLSSRNVNALPWPLWLYLLCCYELALYLIIFLKQVLWDHQANRKDFY